MMKLPHHKVKEKRGETQSRNEGECSLGRRMEEYVQNSV
jgi:hypothetical protein